MRPLLYPILVLAGAVALWTASAEAGAPKDQLRESIGKLIKVLEDPRLARDAKAKERRANIRKVAEEMFDFAESAKRSLARHWQVRTDTEREEFVQLFRDLLERSYISKIEPHKGGRILYTGEAIEGDQATVRTRLVGTQRPPLRVDYRMLRRGERWLAYDVAFDGMSLVANYRTELGRIIQAASYEELVKKLEAKREARTAREEGTPRWVARVLAILSLLGSQRERKSPAGTTIAAESDLKR